MLRKLAFLGLALAFGGIGGVVGYYLVQSGLFIQPLGYGIAALVVALGLMVGIIAAPRLMDLGNLLLARAVEYLQKMPTQDLLFASFGLILGLLIANLIRSLLYVFGWFGQAFSILLAICLVYLGINVAVKKRDEIIGLFGNLSRFGRGEKSGRGEAKLLDTSAIIDGRVADLCKSGFLDGTLIIPGFVLEELQHVADSGDILKRNRGRRGLDIVNQIRRQTDVRVQIYESVKGLEDANGVDAKLVKLSKKLGAKIITTDFNLNKVAEIHGIRVLNINELANALKPVVLPGEEMVIQIIKDGKESGQGVGYLDDGTMIVVDGGKKYIGHGIRVLVTSVLQTTAGRMIFARPKAVVKHDGTIAHELDEVNAVG
ncbi:PIN/TRAM domain-containing protein [Candidatus Desulforudis audaxviator]|uniref:PilT protein domain protein n=1 Tax=Desulforudis audaxviator (strain MP104C) TaxID=477974 RepID=B1I0S8_DESAP|nr:PIN domain-containing protein [Candidatus Desulforudis audaxviator]ACA58749.1 PilT protein domain protein [Candidatus Desulforudis audaxviator MP104C]AZK58759.1 Membrane-associated protein containing RNA-binding TRAM domain and ribonuclease PIN-domain [Candidatus Desulforudis audaxviator]